MAWAEISSHPASRAARSPGLPKLPAHLGALLLLVACARRASFDQAGEVLTYLRVEPEPAHVGRATLILRLEDGAGQPVNGAQLSARGEMTHPGMIPELGAAVSEGSGAYVIPFEWTMAGEWVVTVTGELPDGRRLIRRFAIVVQPGAP